MMRKWVLIRFVAVCLTTGLGGMSCQTVVVGENYRDSVGSDDGSPDDSETDAIKNSNSTETSQDSETAAATESTTPMVVFRNLLILKRYSDIDGVQLTFTDDEIETFRNAFEMDWAMAIQNYTGGNLQMRNVAVVSDLPVTTLGWENDMIEPANVDDWESLLAAVGALDTVSVISPRVQVATWFGSDLLAEPYPTIAWMSFGNCSDFTAPDGDCLSGWTWGFLGAIGTLFYAGKYGLEYVPEIGSGSSFGYAEEQDALINWNAWYRDYFNRVIVDANGISWGLGTDAWQLGNIRDWASNQ